MQFIGKIKEEWVLRIALLIATLVVFQIKFGLTLANPFKYGWLMTRGSDWTPDFQAWEYFRISPWQFPLGLFSGYSWPETISIGLTGAIPLLAIPAKLLHPILPEHFQYFGLWMLFCYLAQAYFALKIFKLFKIYNPVYLFTGTMIVLTSSILLARTGHLNLCAHWILLAGIWIYFDKGLSANKKLGLSCLLNAIAVWVHPYLILFTLALSVSTILKSVFEVELKWWKAIIHLALSLLSVILAWYLLGNFALSFDNKESTGFGYFSANLNAFWNPGGYSLLLPESGYATEGQYEGNAYLGLGILLLIPFLFHYIFKKIVRKRAILIHGPIWFAAAILFIFALSTSITFNEKILGHLDLGYRFEEYASTFRASGRYVWLLFYLILLFSVIGILKTRLNDNYLMVILPLILLLQLIDLSSLLKRDLYISHAPYKSILDKENWSIAFEEANIIMVYPPYSRQIHAGYDNCYFIELAYERRIPINSGHLARYDEAGRKTQQKLLEERLAKADVSVGSREVFVGSAYDLYRFEPFVRSGIVLAYQIDQYFVFIPKGMTEVHQKLQGKAQLQRQSFNYESFEQFIEKNRHYTWLISGRDDARNHLEECSTFLTFMENKGSKIRDMKFRNAYTAVVHQDSLIHETIGESQINVEMNLKFSADTINLSKIIYLKSAGMDHGDQSVIEIEDVDYSRNKRGLNIIILDEIGNVKVSTFFDTFQECFHRTETDNIFEVWLIE